MRRFFRRASCLVGIISVAAFEGRVDARLGSVVQEASAITLESAARDAISWHPSITQARGSLAARSEEIDAARAGYQPQIEAGFGNGYDSRIGSAWRPRPQVSASQMLFDFGKVGSAVEAARAGTRVGRAQFLLAIDGIVRDTALAVIEVQRAIALRDVATRQMERIREIGTLVRERFSRGAATRSDALQAQARLEGAQALMAEVDASRQRWISNLAYLLGRDVAEDAVVPDMPEWLESACAVSPEPSSDVPAIMLAAAQRDEARADLRRSRADQLPTVSLNGGATADAIDPLSSRSIYNLGLNVSSNVFSGGALRARARGAAFALSAAEAGMIAARNDTAQGLAEARQQIAGLERLSRMLFARQENMVETGKLYRLQYLEMGTRTLVDLLNAEQELHQARFDAANTAHDLRRLRIDCLYFSGRARDSFGLTGTSVRGVTI